MNYRQPSATVSGNQKRGRSMRGLVVLALIALSGCAKENSSELVGTWVSEGTGAKVRIEQGGDCRYFPDSDTGGGMKCEWEGLSEKKARLTFSRGGIFAEAEAKLVMDKIYLNTPSGGLDIFQPQ